MKGTLEKALEGHELGEELKAANEKAAEATQLQTRVEELEKQVEEHEGHNLDAAAEHDELTATVTSVSKERDVLQAQLHKALDGHHLEDELKAANEKAALAAELQTKVGTLTTQLEAAQAKADADSKSDSKANSSGSGGGTGPTPEEAAAESEAKYKALESKKSELVGELKAATAAGMKSMQRAQEAERQLHELEESTRVELEAAHAEHAEEVTTHVADQARIEKLTTDNATLQKQRQELLGSLHNSEDEEKMKMVS